MRHRPLIGTRSGRRPNADGEAISLIDGPLSGVIQDRAPAHGSICVQGLDGQWHDIETTVYPLFASAERFVGAVAVFWEQETVKVKVWGCRGSLAAPGPSTVRYGGNTSCVSVTLSDGTVIILDAGSGMRDLGNQIGPRPKGEVHILLTHLHLDHLQGLGFFAPLWQSGVELHVWGPPSSNHSLAERVATYLSPPLFPVLLSDIPSNVVFHDVPTEPWTIGSATVLAADDRAPGSDARIPYRRERAEPRLPARPRALDRYRHLGLGAGVAIGLGPLPVDRCAVPRRPVLRPRVSGSRGLGSFGTQPRR